MSSSTNQQEMFEEAGVRSLLDQLLSDSRLYTQGKDYQELLDFVVRLRNFAPFNAMLLQVQKPGLTYAASAHDWRERFSRTPTEGARPLLILWPFGPVAFVFDVLDTEGEELPEDVSSFFARGPIDEGKMALFKSQVGKKDIQWYPVDAGDARAGSIRLFKRATNANEHAQYHMQINRNHTTPVQFATLTHELGHLFLGHLGVDKMLKVPGRPALTHLQRELEAESVSYLICERNGVKSKSETYLSKLVNQHTTTDDLDIYQVMRAAGQVETLLGLVTSTKYEKPAKS